MSKSLGNAIFLSDSFDTLKGKVQKMYTDPNHIRISDPGQVEGNVVFSFLDVFDPDTAQVQELKEHYRRGGLGDGELKKRLVGVMEDFLAPIRKRRQEFASDLTAVERIIEKGNEVAKAQAHQTLRSVREAMGLRT